MRGNAVEHTVTSGGTGTLTLGAATNKPGFTSLYGSSGTIIVDYWAEEGNSYEHGVGSLVLSTGVLTRTYKEAKWDGSTYTDSPATGINFTTAAVVRCAPTADNNIPTHDIGPSDMQFAANFDNVPTTDTMVADRIYYTPYLWTGRFPVANAGFWLETTAASSSVRFGLYRIATALKPGMLVADFGSLSVASGGGSIRTQPSSSFVVPSAASKRIPVGWYFAAMASNGAPVVGCTDRYWGSICGSYFDRQARYFYRDSFSFGALAADGDSNGSGSYTPGNGPAPGVIWMGP